MKNYEHSIYLKPMEMISSPVVLHEHMVIESSFLGREVWVDIYAPAGIRSLDASDLLLINDGQDLPVMQFDTILEALYSQGRIAPMVIAGIHASPDRKNEYGTSNVLNDRGEGAKALLYSRFILEELIPFIKKEYKISSFKQKSFCGFSLGGLSALDIVWNHPDEFSNTGWLFLLS